MSDDYTTFAIDSESAARLASTGLRFQLLVADSAEFVSWSDAVNRGFYERRPTPEFIENRRTASPYRRMTGVWDDTLPEAGSPVATASSWPTELTVPGGASVTSWAISTITVSPTHRRRGVASAMLEAELRTANALEVPIAILTASEATIYRRWGFAPAAMAATWTVDTTRTRWTGPETSGRVRYVTREQLLTDGLTIVEQSRLATPGVIAFDGHLWERLLGVGDEDATRELRFLQYDDAAGIPQGFAVYRASKEHTPAGEVIIDVPFSAAATEDAYSTLWRFLFELDLVGEVRAELRPVTEPFVWQISDYRAAVKSRERDHLWARILDVPAALEARHYGTPGRTILEVSDDLGFATGTWMLEVAADGTAGATALAPGATSGDDPADTEADTVRVALSVNELAAIYLGGVSATLLARAGAITELTPGAAESLDATFRSTVTPWLSIWF